MTHVQYKDMDPCHSITPRSPAVTSAATVAHLIRNIEQLKNKDKLISQLEKDLGHQWAAVQFAALERTQGEGAEATASGAPSHPPGALPEGRPDPDSFSWTPTSTPTPGDVEDERSAGDEGFGCGKHDLSKKLKERNKELVEKCRAYLQRTKELTAQNRAFKDTSEKALQENKKLQELLEHSKLRLLQVSRHVTELRTERTNVDSQSERVEELKKEMSEDKKTITSLRQALSDKDRRIELIQHRKKRRRVMGSVERNMGVRETFYGYEEDNNSSASQDDSASMSRSISTASTVSEEDWGDELNHEETERKYQRLAMEQLQLQKAHALLQSQFGNLQDPQREALTSSHVQHDLFQAQCRIEQLEKLINEIGEGEVITLLKEREAILTQNKAFYQRIDELESQNNRLSKDLMTSHDSIEELEFRLTELEHLEEETSLTSSCEANLDQCPALGDQGLAHQLAESERQQLAAAVAEMEQLRHDLATLLKGKGKEADAVLRKLDRLKDIEQNAAALEALAHELQMKVITLQKEKDSLQEELALRSVDVPKGDKSSSAAQERLENLELKVEISRLVNAETKLADERNVLLEQVDDWKTQCEHLKYQLDIVTSSQQQLKVKVQEYPSSGDSATESPSSSPSQSPKKLSKDRKSKCRDEDDSTPQSKRRKSSEPLEHSKPLKSFKSFSDVKSINENQTKTKMFQSTENLKPMTSVSDAEEKMLKKIAHLEVQLKDIKDENKNLLDQLKQSALEKNSEAEADQQMLLDRLRAVDTENDLLRRENETLALQLRQRVDEFHDSQDDISPRQCELEDYCEDLQERVHAAESSERHLKDKLRLVEGSLDDAESSEMAIREEYEKLLTREAETKNHLVELQRTGRELRDIIYDKDIVEQALRDKVDFLQKAEAASVQRIEELEVIERDLREQLEVCWSEGSGSQKELNKIQELKHQLTFLETDNKALSSRVSELEENEEILRENWRRVADEDFNRTQNLEEKVKMLESVNKDLKSKLTDAQEYFVINTIPETSLASELAQSQTRRTAAPFQGDDLDSKADSDSEGSETEEVGQLQTEQKVLKEKVWKLERTLSDVSEQKNSKIETLQEKIVSLKENEIKLSETISEMEMTEREIRAKLALYESSEVTVEKMLKYQSKIEELRTSQESLLDQLESMENQEMTLQEKMQEMERTLRGKIVTLEVEMKGSKTKELKAASRIRELEKQEKELSEKLAQQAEKENGLYVKISALMDELKSVKEQNENLNTQLSEKEDKIRKSKLLEVKLLEIEMEFGKKSSALNSKLRHKEEELRQKEVAHDEELKSLKQEHSTKLAEQAQQQSQRTAILDSMYSQKESELQATVSSLEDSVKDITCERDQLEKNVKELTESNKLLKESFEKDEEHKLNELKENLETEKLKAEEAEAKVKNLTEELEKERETVKNIESKMVAMKEDIAEKMKDIELSFVEKEKEYEKEKQSLKDELEMKQNKVVEYEGHLEKSNKRVCELEAACKRFEEEAASQDENVSQKVKELERQMTVKENDMSDLESQVCEKEKDVQELKRQLSEKEDLHKEKALVMEREKEELEKELRNKVMFLNTQLLQEAAAREEQMSNLELKENQEVTQAAEIDNLKQSLMEKLSELEQQNKENCELSLELSQSRHNEETLQLELSTAREQWGKTEVDLQNQLYDRDQTIDKTNNNLKNLQVQFAELESSLSEKEISLGEISSKFDLLQQKLSEQEKVVEEKCQKEEAAQEQIQKKEIMLQETSIEKQEREAELNQLKAAIEEKMALLSHSQSEKEDNMSKLERSMSDVSTLEEKVSQLESELSQAQKALQVQDEQLHQNAQLLILRNTEVEGLQKKLEEKEKEVADKDLEYTTSHSQILSQISGKQQELEHAQMELYKCLQDIEQVKNECMEKDKKLQQQDQTYNGLLAEQHELAQQLQQSDVENKSMESKNAEFQQELKEVENRYQELDAKCARLEMQLEERYASAQDAEKVVLAKHNEVEILEAKLMSLQKLYTESCADLQKFEAEYTDMQSRQVELEEQYTESQSILEKQATDYQRLEKELHDLDNECQSLKEKSSGMPDKVANLESQVEMLRSALAESESQCKNMLSKVEEMTQTVKFAQEKCEEKEMQLCDMENQLKGTVSKSSLEDAESKLIDKEKENEVLALKLEDASENTGKLEARIADLADKLTIAEQKLQSSMIENDQLQSSISIIENKLLEKEKSNEETQVWYESLRQENNDFQTECDYLQKKVAHLQDELSAKNIECEKSSVKIKDLEISIQQTGQALQDNETELAEVLEKLLDEEAKTKDAQAQLEHSQKSRAHSEESSQEFRDEAEAMRLEVNRLTATNEELTGKYSRLMDSETEMTGLCSELKGKLDSLQKEHQDQVKDLEDVKQVLTEEQRLLSECRSELDIVLKQNVSKSEQLEELESKQEEFLSTIKELEAENNLLKTKVQTLESVLKDSQLDGSDIMQVNEDLRAQIVELEKEVQERVQRCDSLEANLEENSMEKDIAIAEVKHLQGLNTQLNAEISGLHEELEDASKEFDNLRNSFEEGKSNIEGEVNAAAQGKEEVKLELSSLQSLYKEQGLQLEDALKQVEVAHERIAGLSKDVDEGSKFFVNNDSEVNILKQRQKDYERELEDSNERLSELEERNRLAERTIESLQKEKSFLMNDKADAVAQYSECRVKLFKESAECKELKKQVDNLSAEKDNLKKHIESLNKNLRDDENGKEGALSEDIEDNLVSFVSNIPTRKALKDVSEELNYEPVPVDEDDISLSFVSAVSAPVPMKETLKKSSEEVRDNVPVQEDLIIPSATPKKETVAPVSVDDNDFFSFVSSIPNRREVKDVCEDVNYDVVSVEEKDSSVSCVSKSPPANVDTVNFVDNKVGGVNHVDVDRTSKMQELMNEISVYKERDGAQQDKLNNLESSLKEMQKREAKLSSRVEELEEKEKDLLEQMTDIEQTVIVPLESENQELKDELRIVKQERDDAFAVASLNEDESEQDVESLRKSLEDSLLQRDELEKKVNILSDEVSSLESEKESLFQKISEFEVEKVENDEKMENLEEKVRRLPILEKQTTIVEESENILMDKVLDLEEREQQLIAEVKELKSSQTQQTDLKEKLTYLQQKNEVLQDAEEKYMNKIMELEESLHSLGSEMSLLKSKAASKESLSQESLSVEEFISPDKSVHTESLSQVTGAKSHISTCHVSVDTSDLFMQTPDVEVSTPEILRQLNLFKSENDKLSSEMEEKQTQLNSLQEKLVLLQDSEAGLMEKLLEAEEKSESSKVKISRTQSDLEKKIETLVEENEYLAGNVENYKQLYKEEKGKVNDLQEILQDTQVELESTQTMVEDIQSEYEDQLANRDAMIASKDVELNSKSEELVAKDSEWEKLNEHHKRVENELNTKDAQLAAQEAELAAKDSELKRMAEQQLQDNTERETEDKECQTKENTADSSGRVTELQERIQYLLKQNDKLQNTVDSQNQVEEDLRAQDKLRKQELQGKLDAVTQRKEELRVQHKEREQNLQLDLDAASQREQKLKMELEAVSQQLQGCSKELEEVTDREYKLHQELEAVSQREQTALHELEVLTKEIQELRQAVHVLKQNMATQDRRRDFEENSESSTSVEELRIRYETASASSAAPAVTQANRTPSPRQTKTPSPTIQQLQGIYESKASVTLSRPTSTSPHTISPDSTSPQHTAKNPPIAPQDARKTPSPVPVAPPRSHRKIRSRPSSIESSVSLHSQEDLSLLVVDLQEREAALKKRVAELEAAQKDSIQLSHRVAELEAEYQTLEASNQTLDATNQILERRVEFAESQSDSSKDNGRALSKDGALRGRWLRGDLGRTREVVEEEEVVNTQFDPSFSSVASMSSGIMLDKPEDVLTQRIKELERLDQHNKNQMSELERDREVLHEIARKDKATIHELNVKIRELQLSERSLREQVNSLESSESSLFARCDELEATKTKLEDRVHELEIHERRLRELVRKLKLDEEQWLGKTSGMETAVAELSANEQQLKRLLQDVELERGGLTERAEYLEARIRELENVEVTLLQRVKNYENNEVTLQNQLVHLENSESAAQSKASELDVINMDLSQRLQRAVEENAVLSQHATQLHGQVQDLDRRLMTSRDSELAYKQHVESLQKNESSLQKKVREYELREIDSQAKIRELEQTSEITNDKLATLQRSENKLKYRVHELEGIGGQIPGEMTPAQRQKVPQKLEDCQKRVLVLQSQVENLQLQLRQAFSVAQSANTSQEEDDNVLTVPKDDYMMLQTKSSLLEETTYQLEQVEKLNEELNATILQLRQGKGASGHEVEIEVLKRRLDSYKTLISKLKSSLSTGQATSLLEPEQASGPEGDSLSARPLHGLASERVLQSVRGIHNGKANSHKQGDAQNLGLAQSEDSFVQSTAAETMSANLQLSQDDDGSSKSGQSSSREESHWRAIEARKPTVAGSSRGGAKPVAEGVTRVSHSARPIQSGSGGLPVDGVEEEEVTIGLHLPSESELSSYHRTTQNDTDSSNGPVPPPRRGRVSKVVPNENNSVSSSSESSDGQMAYELSSPAVAANKKHFAKDKSLPSPARKDPLTEQWTMQQQQLQQQQQQQQQQAPLIGFGEDSFYLPSSAQEDLDSLEDEEAPPPLPSSGPPGAGALPPSLDNSLNDSSPRGEDGQQERRDSLDKDSTSGMSIRERIAHIEKQLQSEKSGPSDDEQIFYWKKKSSDALRQAEGLEKDNRHLKEDINRLEKELEEKRRHINILELWLSSIEDLMKNKDKKADRAMIEQLQLDLTRLRRELGQVGYRGEDAVLDSAALKTELERREREIMSKKAEVDVVSLELQRVRKERDSIEGMRRTALDSLRALERELVDLQDNETKLEQTQTKLKELQAQYDEMENYKNQAVNMIQPLQAQVDRLTRKCQDKDILLSRLGAELRRVSHRPSSALDDLTRLEQIMSAEEYNKNQANHKAGERRAGHMRSSSMDDLDLGYPLSDAESVGGGLTSGSPAKKQRPTPYVNNRPRSAEALSPGQRAQRGIHAHSRWTAPHRTRDNQQLLGDGVTRGQYMAIADYDPGLFSQSGRPGLELGLREGDHVLVTGPMDQSGYYEAVVSGRSGLVPANYLQPLHLNGHLTPGTHLDHSPEQMMDLYRRLQHPESALGPSQGNTPAPRGSRSTPSVGPVSNKKNLQVPEPPHHLHVKGIVNEKSILLSWLPPAMDAQGNSNGLKVLGYMVYLDGAEYEQLSSAHQCEVVVEGLSSDRPHCLAVQSLCAGGYASPRAELVFEGMVKLGQGQVEGQGGMDTDLSSVLNSVQYKRGHKRTVMALYDYSPEQQSPHDYTALELPFHAGDIIHVYGEPRQDGFYHGEIDDKRGLIPACFVEDIAKLNRTQDKLKAPGYKSS